MTDELIQDQIMNQINTPGSQITDQQVQQAEKKQENPEAASESTKEHNIREYNIREMRRRLEESERRAKELEEQVRNQRASKSPSHDHDHSSDDAINIGDDDLIEGKHLKKYVNNITRQFEKKIEEMHAQSAASSAESRLKAQYQDFDSIVSTDNLKSFQAIYPEEYASMMSNSDLYSKAKTAYTMIKNLGIAENQYHDADRRLSENKTKPRAAASIAPQAADTPISRIGDYDRRVLTEADKERLRRQVADAKQFGGR